MRRTVMLLAALGAAAVLVAQAAASSKPSVAIKSTTVKGGVVVCAGQWTRELAARVGVNVPLVSVEHQYLITAQIEGITRDLPTLRDFPIRPLGVREAIARALANEDQALAETRWSDALSAAADPPAGPTSRG